MKNKLEAVIFDWAGTTVDYGSFAPVQAFIEAFKKFGITPTPDEVRKPMGMLKRDHIQTMLEMPRIYDEWVRVHNRAWTNEDVEAVYLESERSIMPILKDFADPKPFVLETVAVLKEKGIRVGSTTGYTDAMMDIVVPCAKEKGYSPDFWCSPNAVDNIGRPYPFMLFHNMKQLGIASVHAVAKVGDTVADIKEAKNAGVFAVGIVEGSSVMGLSEDEYTALSPVKKEKEIERVVDVYKKAGADAVILNMSELIGVIENQYNI